MQLVDVLRVELGLDGLLVSLGRSTVARAPHHRQAATAGDRRHPLPGATKGPLVEVKWSGAQGVVQTRRLLFCRD